MFSPGMQVMIRARDDPTVRVHKLRPRYTGPYKIVREYQNNVEVIDWRPHRKVALIHKYKNEARNIPKFERYLVNKDRLKPCGDLSHYFDENLSRRFFQEFWDLIRDVQPITDIERMANPSQFVHEMPKHRPSSLITPAQVGITHPPLIPRHLFTDESGIHRPKSTHSGLPRVDRSTTTMSSIHTSQTEKGADLQDINQTDEDERSEISLQEDQYQTNNMEDDNQIQDEEVITLPSDGSEREEENDDGNDQANDQLDNQIRNETQTGTTNRPKITTNTGPLTRLQIKQKYETRKHYDPNEDHRSQSKYNSTKIYKKGIDHKTKQERIISPHPPIREIWKQSEKPGGSVKSKTTSQMAGQSQTNAEVDRYSVMPLPGGTSVLIPDKSNQTVKNSTKSIKPNEQSNIERNK